jgi:ankyrin repeat protein
MPIVPLPDEPDLEQLRAQARDLQRAVRSGQPAALAEVAEHHPDGPPDPSAIAGFRLSAAQLVVARRSGFASWSRLRRRVETVQRFSRFPSRLSRLSSEPIEPVDPAEWFLRLACLDYDDNGPEQWAQAREVLSAHPELTAGHVHAAAATGDLPALRAALAADRLAARREGGPYRWEPLMYLAYARHDPDIAESTVLGAARLLLEAGADPNAGYLWHGLLSPFTVLTGVFGEGEAGPLRQPRHPRALSLARLLLEAGADPNDAQALYNRMFEPDDDHLALLFAFGLGLGNGGPWRARIGEGHPSPPQLVRDQLAWAITHGMTERVRLLATHGADLVTPFDDGTTPAARALTTGHPELADELVRLGAPQPDLSPGAALVAAVLAADRARVEEVTRRHPGVVKRVRDRRPGLMAWAAAAGRPGSVELLVELGFDVNARGRTDVPGNRPWQTALHKAAEDGNLELARTLLRLGADPDLTDQRFGGTPLDWAHHFVRTEMIELLEPLTTPETAERPEG